MLYDNYELPCKLNKAIKLVTDWLTSIEPENKRPGCSVAGCFRQPVEESSTMMVINSNVAGELFECNRGLTREICDPISFMGGGRCIGSNETETREECGEWEEKEMKRS